MSRHQNSRGYNTKQSQFVYVAKTTEEEAVTVEDKPHYNNDKPQNRQYDDQRQQGNQYNNNKQYNKPKQYQQQPYQQQQQQQQYQQSYNQYPQNEKKQRNPLNRDKPKQQQQTKPLDDDYRRDPLPGQSEENEHFDISTVKQKELTQVLTKLFKTRRIECLICCNLVYQDARIWSCSQCFQPFHLQCIHKWIKNNNLSNTKLFNWSCPKCNLLYQEELPEYRCFCGKTTEPELDKYSIPHSCQEKCQKKRGKYCPHPCPMDCHPGPCPECHVQGVEIKCHCGKSQKQISCSENAKHYSCNSPCNKVLNCGEHTCQRQCHSGKCEPCKENKQIKCYCDSETKTINCAEKGFSCTRVCGRTLDCGNHKCEQFCHAQCIPCPLKPELVLTCPCKKYKLSEMLPTPRKSCLDPIPNCGMPIESILACGHKSRTVCGSQYPPCTQKIKQSCRCGEKERISLCQDKEVYLCERVCKKKKSCQSHPCNQQCCPPDAQQQGLHLCLKVCGKALSCGKHTCELFCHLGGCQPCPIAINQPITCPCGKSVKNPPQKCGTGPPACYEVCDKQLPSCEHKCQTGCHSGKCPACQEQVLKECRCKAESMMVQCTKIAICMKVCRKVLNCGHFCPEVCQATQECPLNNQQNCGQKCSATRQCGHCCQEICHPNKECPPVPCRTQVRVVCACGNRDTFLECEAIGEPVEKSLKCDQRCQNIKRFGAFYKSNHLVDIEKTYYPDLLLKFAHYNQQQLMKLEQKLENYLITSKPKECYDYQFQRNEHSEMKKKALQILFARHYKLEVQVLSTSKNISFTLFKTADTLIPKIKLSDYLIKVQKGVIKRDHSPFKAKLKTNHEFTPMEIQSIEQQLLDYKNDYYSERLGYFWVLNFWEEAQAESVLKKLKKMVGLLTVQWTIELNAQALEEDQRQQEGALESEIIVKQPVAKKQQKAVMYEEESFQLTYTAWKEQEFKQLQSEYWDKCQVTVMCGDDEIYERIEQNDVSIFEQDPFYQYEVLPMKDRMVRKYKRVIEPTPTYLRTPDTLIKTVDFLLYNYLEAETRDFKKPMDENQMIRDIKFEDIWEFINDRLKQVRMELLHINYQGNIYVKMIRFYVVSHSQLKDNKENLKELSILLSEFVNQETFQYNLILQCFLDQDVNLMTQQQADLQLQDNIEINELISLVVAVRSQQYTKYIDYYSTTSNLLIKSLMHGSIYKVYIHLTNIFLKASMTMGLSEYVDALKLPTMQMAVNFLQQYGIDTTKTQEELDLYSKEPENGVMPVIYFQRSGRECKIAFQPLVIDRSIVYN